MARKKHHKALEILHSIAERVVLISKDLDSVMGRLQWATSTCPLAKPLLPVLARRAAMWAVGSVTKTQF